MSDSDLKDERLRRTLRAVAERSPVPDAEVPWSPPTAPAVPRSRLVLVVAAVVTVATALVLAIVYGPRSSDVTGSTPSASHGSPSVLRWSPARDVAPHFAVTGVACPSPTFCLGLGADDRTGTAGTTLWNGSRRSSPRSLGAPATGTVSTMACASPVFCEALGPGSAYRWNGRGWTSGPLPVGASPGTVDVTSVSCPAASFCMAVDAAGQELTYDGRTWSAPRLFDRTTGGQGAPGGPVSVSCASSTFCMVADSDGYALQWNGTSWSTPVDITPPTLVAVSCPTRRWCLAINQNSYASLWNGQRWSRPRFVDPESMGLSQIPSTTPVSWGQGDFGLLSASCASRSFCVAIDDSGYAVDFDGTSWSTPVVFGAGQDNLDMVACTRSRFCVVTSAGGGVVVGRG